MQQDHTPVYHTKVYVDCMEHVYIVYAWFMLKLLIVGFTFARRAQWTAQRQSLSPTIVNFILTTCREKPSKDLEKPLPFELSAAEGDDNEKQEGKGMYFAELLDEKRLSELDDNALPPAFPD